MVEVRTEKRRSNLIRFGQDARIVQLLQRIVGLLHQGFRFVLKTMAARDRVERREES